MNDPACLLRLLPILHIIYSTWERVKIMYEAKIQMQRKIETTFTLRLLVKYSTRNSEIGRQLKGAATNNWFKMVSRLV
jgi:hypothetical protein